MSIKIPAAELDEWLTVLKPYQRKTIEAYLSGGTPEDAAEKWLAATGSPNIVPFGGQANPKPFWDNFKAEFRKFVCDDTAYADEKKALASESPVSKAILVSAVSAAIGAQIGYTATLLAPAVTVLLCTVGKMSIAAYCASP
jgi:hypothetical protein